MNQIKLNYQIVSNQVLLTWDGNGSYYIYRRTDSPNSLIEPIGQPYRKVNGNRFRNTIPNCSAYTYMVTTPDQVTTSEQITVANLSCNNSLPITLAGNFSNGQIHLNWNPIRNANSYYVLQVSSPQDSVGILDYASQNTTSISFPSKTTGQNIFRVVAYDNTGIVGLSNPVTITTNTITNFQILNINPSSAGVSFNWIPLANSQYTINRNGMDIGTSSIPSFTDKNIEVGKTYTYIVSTNNQATSPVTITVPNTSGNNNIPIVPLTPPINQPNPGNVIEESSFGQYFFIVSLFLIFIILIVVLFANTRRTR